MQFVHVKVPLWLQKIWQCKPGLSQIITVRNVLTKLLNQSRHTIWTDTYNFSIWRINTEYRKQ